MSEYLSNVVSALSTAFEGMSVTFSHLFRTPYTVQYPDRMPVRVQDTLPYRYRGILDVDLEICTGCLACERACPIDCIVIEAKKDENKQMVLSRFDIDIAKCMYCGLCSEPCPTGSIHHTREFEGAGYSLETLYLRFVDAPVPAYKVKKSGEDDPAVLPILERGLRYVDEFAQPAAPVKEAAAAKAAPAKDAPAKPPAEAKTAPVKASAAKEGAAASPAKASDEKKGEADA